MLLHNLQKQKLIHPPDWLCDNTVYLTIMGSMAYGVNTDSSDIDIYGICIPKKEMVFPHLTGEILGFGKQINRFEQWQEHHIKTTNSKEYDFGVYNIVKYFQLLMENNPNIIDSIFTPRECIIHSTHTGELIRENRKIFLHKGAFHKFKGYSFSQKNKMDNIKNRQLVKNIRAFEDEHGISHNITYKDVLNENPEIYQILNKDTMVEYIRLFQEGISDNKRFESHKIFNTDVKFMYHLMRLLSEIEQILIEGDLDLRRNNEQYKAIRRGEMSEEDINKWFTNKELQLEKLYSESTLQWGPDEDKIKQLLINCLEHHYGSLEKCLVEPDKAIKALEEIKQIVSKF